MTLRKDSPEYIDWLLIMNDRAVEKAVLAIYNRQENDEKISSNTRHSNGIGFSGADARRGTYYARWILGEIRGVPMRLTGHHLDNARVMMRKYVKQLANIAAEKLERQAIQSEGSVSKEG